MDIALKIIYNVGIFFILMIPGIVLKKCRLVPDGFGKGVSNLVLYIAQPALVFISYLKEFNLEVLKNALIVLLLSVIAHVVFLLALLFYKKTGEDRMRMLRFATIFSNAAFMGMPLIQAINEELVIYASIYNITFNMFLWTLGVHICTNNNVLDDGTRLESQASIKKALLHPVTIAAALGLILFFLPINDYTANPVAALAIESLTKISNLVAPLSMLVLGLRLADIDLKGFFRQKYLYVFIALRHILLPAIVFGIIVALRAIGLPVSNDVFKIIIIMASAPAASSATMFAEKYDCDAAYVSKLVAVSTILSILTMPLLALPIDYI